MTPLDELRTYVAGVLDKHNQTLSIIGATFDLMVDKDLAEDLIINDGTQLKILITHEQLALVNVLPGDIWLDTLKEI